MSNEPKQYTLLRRLLKAIGLSDERIDELIATIQAWLADDNQESGKPQFPYRLRDDFLSPAELNFYRALQTAVADWAMLFTKVNLGDLFYASTGDQGQNQAYRNRISRKHLDFLLCDPNTLRPLLGIELDDSSHNRSDRQQRDQFVDGVFAAAGLPLVHVRVSHSYSPDKLRAFLRRTAALDNGAESARPDKTEEKGTAVPHCPECGAPMVLRTAQKGTNAGNQFWGCAQYPRCRGISPVQ
ncbi:MAG: DUF2726 domain-containing protein [Anaerolineae bacterium]|nr:DUF2726 domain-containing protein [Anaerolineae bacterium]